MSHHLRLLVLSATLGYKALFAWNTPGLFFVSLVLTPALQILFFIVMGEAFGYADPSFFVLGNAVQIAAAAGVSGLIGVIADERRFGTLSVLLSSPGSRLVVFVGRMLPGIVLGASVSLAALLWGLLIAPWAVTGPAVATAVCAVLASAFSSAALGLFLSALGLVHRDIFQIATATYLVTMLVSGANISRGDLPVPLRLLGDVLPQSHAIDAIRMLAHGSSARAGAPVLIEIAVGVAWLLAALLGMRILESQARRSGRVELH